MVDKSIDIWKVVQYKKAVLQNTHTKSLTSILDSAKKSMLIVCPYIQDECSSAYFADRVQYFRSFNRLIEYD